VEDRNLNQDLDHDVKIERRRPGRIDYKHAGLIRLFRGSYDSKVNQSKDISADPIVDDRSEALPAKPDDLRTARGILTALALGTGLWIILAALLFLVV
jgi:hypothetical protein